MYNSYFGFSESPFENKLNQNFLFLGKDHREILAALMYFIQEKKGFAVVCGDVGTGKSMLINCFLSNLSESIHPIVILNPNFSYNQLLQYIAKELRLPKIEENILELTDDIKEALINEKNRGKSYVLVVDEAHLLPNASLEDVRLLSNIEIPEQKLLQILLVGQYELSRNLDLPEMRQLRQRINISRFLSPLSPAETSEYVNYRLSKVGSSLAACFEPNCRSLIYRMSQGIPRKINQICDNALLICLAENRRKINRAILKKAQEALLTDHIFTPQASSGERRSMTRHRRAIIPVISVALILGVVLGQSGLSGQGLLRLFSPPSLFSVRSGASPDKAEVHNPAAFIAGTASGGQERMSAGPSNQPANPPRSLANSDSELKAAASSLMAATKPETDVVPDHSIIPKSQDVPKAPSGDLREPTPSPEATPGFISSQRASAPRPFNANGLVPPQMVIKPGDTLSKIAERWYTPNVDLGLEAIILANLKNAKEDIIHPGETLFLPEINFSNRLIKLRDNLYYTPLAQFRSFSSLPRIMSILTEYRVRYLLINTIDGGGVTTHRLFLGGYERTKELEKALRTISDKIPQG